jgi:hypothetical protein
VAKHYVTSYFEAKLTGVIAKDFSNSETQELRFFSPENIPDEMAMISPCWLTDVMSKSNDVFIR